MKIKLSILALLLITLVSCSPDGEPAPEPELTPEPRVEDKIHRGNVTLRTQEDVNAFGEKDITIIVGEVTIGIQYPNDINDLSPLTNLRKVDGNLTILGTIAENLEDISSMDSVTQDFQIVLNYELKSLKGLEDLSFVGNQLTIHDNHALTNLEGLGELESIPTVWIAHNNGLESLLGLESIKVVRDYIQITNNIELHDLCGLTPILENESVEVDIYGNEFNPPKEWIMNGNCDNQI